MALPSLLRRIANPVLLSPSGPRLGPVLGMSPAAAARFVKTGSQGEDKTVAEQESTRVISQRYIDEQNNHDKEFAQLQETAKERLAEFSRATANYRKVGNASVVVIAAIPLIMIIGSNYLA